MTIGEGLETTIAGMMKGRAPAWAVGTDGALSKFPVLAGVDCLTILGLRFGGLNHIAPGVGWVELLAKPIISAAAPAWVSLRSTHPTVIGFLESLP